MLSVPVQLNNKRGDVKLKKMWIVGVLLTLLGSLLAAACVVSQPTVVNFSVNPSVIAEGQEATLSWDVSNATLVRIDPFSGNQYSKGSTIVSPGSTTTYVLIASNTGGSVTATTLLTVNPKAEINPNEGVTPSTNVPVVQSFTATPPIIVSGASASLKWDVSGATSAFIEPNVGPVPLSGSQIVSPAYSTSYVLTANNATNTVSSTAELSVNPAPTYAPPYSVPYPSSSVGVIPLINFFDINPPVINSGSSTTVQWNVSNADTVFIDHGIGNVANQGTWTITPQSTTSYTITATNIYGSVTSSATVVVNPAPGAPAILTFTGSPASISEGSSSNLVWNVTGATSVSIDHGIGSVPLSGSRTASPSVTTTYTLTASNSSGLVYASTTITINPTGGLPVIVNFTANPNSVNVGNSSILQWNVTGATSASIDQGVGAMATSGTQLVTPNTTTTYTLTATNAAGSVSASATVNIVGVSNLPVILRFSIYPTSIQPGDWADLQWQVGGATSVSIDQGVGGVNASGDLQVSPAATRTYAITAANSAGSTTAAVTLTVIPVTGQPFIEMFSASPDSVRFGDSTTIEWQVIGATSVSITPGVGTVPLSGSRTVSPGETTPYIITATNKYGVTTHTALVTVTFQPK